MIFVARLQAFQDVNRVRDTRFVDIDLLETPHQGAVLFEELSIFLIGGRADAAHGSGCQSRFQQIRSVHSATRRGAGTDDSVNFINEENRTFIVFDLFHHLLQAFFKIAAIACAGQKCSHIQRKHSRSQQDFRHIAFNDAFRQSFGDGSFADARITHQKRIVLLPAAQNLDHPLHFTVTADQWVNFALGCLFVEVNTIGRQSVRRFLVFGLVGFHRCGIFVFSAGDRTRFRHARPFGDSVADIVHRVVAGHILFLEKISRMAFPFSKNCDQNVCAGHFLAAGRLDMYHRPLNDALEAGGRLGIDIGIGNQIAQFRIDIFHQITAQQIEVYPAGTHYGGRIGIIRQRMKQMLQRGIFLSPLIGLSQGVVEGFFQTS